VLLEHLEEEFDLPAVSVDLGDGSGAKTEMVSEKLGLSLVLVVPDYYSAQQPWILEPSSRPGEANKLVGEDIGPLRQWAVVYDFIGGVAFESGNEENTGAIPLSKEVKVVVAPIHSDDASPRKRELTSGGNVGSLAISDHGEFR